ncbi:MAG TPA: hypothetical protein VGG41_18800 [Solirubrobacteraceae bacterium]
MSRAAQLPIDPKGPAGATGAHDRRQRWRTPPAWLWGASVLVQVACAAALTSYTFFFVDDFLFLGQARTQSLSLTYLRENLFEHFSPISRVLDTVLVAVAPGSFVLAHAFELVMYAGALIAFAMVVRWILGNGWIALVMTLLFGQSIFVIRLLNWWTATANILPSTLFMLLALGCYLRWRESRSGTLLAACLVSYTLSLLDYETAILFPAYLAAITFLVLERDLSPRGWLHTLWRERWVWVGLVVLDAAAIINYYANYYAAAARPSLSSVAHYIEIALFQTFIPALVGIKYPAHPGRHTTAIVAATLVVVAAVAVTLYLRPRAWRCLLAFALVFLLTMLPVALTRIREFGVSIGHVIYYQQSLQFMFLILAALAISPRWGGQRSRSSASRSLRVLALRRPSSGALAVVGVAAAAAYAVLLLTSLSAMSRASWQPRQNSAYVHTYLASDRRLRKITGTEPVLVDLKVPKQVLPTPLWPYTTYAHFFALFNPRLRVDKIAKRIYVIARRGRLVPVRFAADRRGSIERARASDRLGSDSASAPRRSRSLACAAGTRSWLQVPLARPQRMVSLPPDLAYAIQVRFRMPANSWISVKLLAKRRGLGFATVTHFWGRGRGGELLPLQFTGVVRELAFHLPPRACLTNVEFGRLRFTGSE